LNPIKHKIIIIGAGPAGLAIAGRLRRRNIDFQILEATSKIASAWHNHYDRLHLHTVKQWSHLPHFPFPKDYPIYIPRKKLIEYYANYSRKFEINPIFNKQVISIEKNNTFWQIRTKDAGLYQAEKVIVSTGVNRIPVRPNFEGENLFAGEIIHSKKYKNPIAFKGKKVLVVGMGNTGAEIALDLSEQDIETFLSVRGPVNIVPRDLNGRPVQITAKKLAKLPFGIGQWLSNQIRKIYIGNLDKYGIETPKKSPFKQLHETGKTPVVDIGTVAAIKAGKIKVLPDIIKLSATCAYFSNETEQKIDAIILATGYKPKIEEFIERGLEVLDKFDCPNTPIGSGFHKNMYFLGFDNYKLGGILGILIDESKQIADAVELSLKEQ